MIEKSRIFTKMDICSKIKFVKTVAKATLEKDSKQFESLLKSLLFDHDSHGYMHLLEPLFIVFRPKASFILNISHVFCEDCCEMYTPSHVSQWIENNPELHDSEILFLSELFETFHEYIQIDIVPYTLEEVLDTSNQTRVSTQTDDEKLKQLYSIVLHHDDLDD